MLQSRLLGETKKEWPSEATVKSHGLLLKGGYVKQMASGIYTLLPLAKKVVSKIEQIIREEMNGIGSQEVLMPLVATKKLWDLSGRYQSVGSELLRFQDRNKAEMVLSMTHEEAVVFSLLNEGKTYQKYPFSVYQIQTKFRDEARPRAGLIRVREFTMKDAYSFHTSEESLEEEYEKFYQAYLRIYKRVGIPEVVPVFSDTGMMGGSGAHEYMLLCEAGEDKIVICNQCDYRANMEVAYTKQYEVATKEEQEIQKIHTPGIKTIEALANFTGLKESSMGKAVIYERLDTHQTILVFIRADREVNETKLRNLLKIDDEELVPKKVEEKDTITYGFVGPLSLTVENAIILYDLSLQNEKNLVFGANEIDYHYTGISMSRDLPEVSYVDVAKVKESDSCPLCNHSSLCIANGIEVGNIFKLGIKYTQTMNMRYLDENGKEQVPLMGCYGIGVGRLMASILEKRATESKVHWPASIAPFDVHICPLDYTKKESVKKAADQLYYALLEKGWDVLLDDRSKSAGVKFADSDLIGATIRVVMSERNLEKEQIEIRLSSEEESRFVSIQEIESYIEKTIKSLKEE